MLCFFFFFFFLCLMDGEGSVCIHMTQISADAINNHQTRCMGCCSNQGIKNAAMSVPIAMILSLSPKSRPPAFFGAICNI
jgi:hypothetical protein